MRLDGCLAASQIAGFFSAAALSSSHVTKSSILERARISWFSIRYDFLLAAAIPYAQVDPNR